MIRRIIKRGPSIANRTSEAPPEVLPTAKELYPRLSMDFLGYKSTTHICPDVDVSMSLLFKALSPLVDSLFFIRKSKKGSKTGSEVCYVV